MAGALHDKIARVWVSYWMALLHVLSAEWWGRRGRLAPEPGWSSALEYRAECMSLHELASATRTSTRHACIGRREPVRPNRDTGVHAVCRDLRRASRVEWSGV